MKSILSLMLFSVTFAFAANANQLPESQRLSTVLAVSGHAWKVSEGTKNVQLRVGDHLKPKSVIETDASGKLTLKLGNDVAVEVRPSTHFTIDLEQNQDWLVKLESGAMLSAVKNPEKRKDHFKIKTHAATLGVRGTAFYVREEAGKPTYLCTCHGTVQARDASGKLIQEFSTTHHNEPVLLSEKVEKIPMDHDHNDADVAALEHFL
jgi:ferric-dicitrate binding protein FerR (iron transport regulator)